MHQVCEQCGCRLPEDAASENEQLRAALIAAREKLEAYYKDTKAEYPGGPLYGDLMKQIDAALSIHG